MVNKKATSGDRSRKSNTIDIGGHVGNLQILENGTAPYELRIDREGRWFHEGIEIIREDIRSLFSQNLVRDKDGNYIIRIGKDECFVTVEDAPFVVVRVTRRLEEGLMLLLNDGSEEPLDPRTVEINSSNVPYCCVRSNLKARFSRPAYYQLAEFIEYDEKNEKCYLVLDGQIQELDIR